MECYSDEMCCCKCRYLARVTLSCSYQRAKGYSTVADGCICHIQIGWACICMGVKDSELYHERDGHPEIKWYGDTEHGICEVFDPIENNGNERKGYTRIETP